MFGKPFNVDEQIVRPLETQGIRRLYPLNCDHKRELKKLNHSILANFLDLLDILIKSPDSHKRVEKIEDLEQLFINMHHLINEFRPHQARETLRVMLEEQKKKRLETAARFEHHLVKVQEMLRNCLSGLPDEETLDSKLLIKTESMETDNAGSTPLFQVKRENVNGDDDDEGTSHVNMGDRMMCDIVDALN